MSDNTSFQAWLLKALRKNDASVFKSPTSVATYFQAINESKVQLEDFRSQLANFTTLQTQSNTVVQQYNKLISGTTNPVLIAQYKADRAPYLNDYKAYSERISTMNSFIKAVEKAQKPIKPDLLARSASAYAYTPIKLIVKSGLTRITYNVGSVREAYFSGKEEFLRETSVHPGNTPVQVDNAANLWAGGFANKGMIQTWTPPVSGVNSTKGKTDPEAKNASTYGMPGKTTPLQPHGFQFQYNPTNVTMVYSGTPSVDMMYEASGQDKFNFVGTGTTQSTIGFQILLNRVYDMKYYDSSGHLRSNAKNAYFPVQPTLKEQEAIYNQGTMYDVEFLLRTLLGVTMDSYLRKDYLGNGTADMGFVAAVPVELHLGQNMRYLVWINQLSINHVLFNERMVPLFSTVDISCNRMPDFASFADGTGLSEADKALAAGAMAAVEDGRAAAVYTDIAKNIAENVITGLGY